MTNETLAALGEAGLWLAVFAVSLATAAALYYAARAVLSLAYGAWLRARGEAARPTSIYDQEAHNAPQR